MKEMNPFGNYLIYFFNQGFTLLYSNSQPNKASKKIFHPFPSEYAVFERLRFSNNKSLQVVP